jgi:hypothetical protein
MDFISHRIELPRPSSKRKNARPRLETPPQPKLDISDSNINGNRSPAKPRLKIRSSSRVKSSIERLLSSHTPSPSRLEPRPKLFINRKSERIFSEITDDIKQSSLRNSISRPLSKEENSTLIKQTLTKLKKEKSKRKALSQKVIEIETKHSVTVSQLNEEISALKLREKQLVSELDEYRSKMSSYKSEVISLIEVVAELIEAGTRDVSFLDSRASSLHNSIDHHEEGKI